MGVSYGAGAALTYVKTAHAAADDHHAKASAAERAGDKATAESEMRKSAAHERSLSKLSDNMRERISASPSGLIPKDQEGWLAKFGRGSLRSLPGVGTTWTGFTTVSDIAMGKDPGKASAEAGGSIVGGALRELRELLRALWFHTSALPRWAPSAPV